MGWAVGCVVVLAACGQQEARASSGGGRDGKLDRPAADRPTVEELLAAFDADGAIRTPPIGEEYGSNELHVEAEIIGEEGQSMRALLEPQIVEALADYNYDEIDLRDGLAMLELGYDIRSSLEVGYLTDDVRDRLIENFASDGSDVAAVLQNSLANYSWFRIYDTSAEIVAHDVVIVRPYGSDKAVALRVTYVHS